MRSSLWTTVNRYLSNVKQWYESTAERALDQAYDAALTIQAIEDEHFGGKKISPTSQNYSPNTYEYFDSELRKYLKITKIRLSEFQASRSFFNTTNGSASARSGVASLRDREPAAILLEKLKFIDTVLDRYDPSTSPSVALIPIEPNRREGVALSNGAAIPTPNASQPQIDPYAAPRVDGKENMLDKTGVLPRSILGTLNRIRRDLDPNSEQEVVQSFRNNKTRTTAAIRFLLLLVIIPLLAQQLSKVFVVGPVVEHFRSNIDQGSLFINFELQEQALKELQTFRETIEFDTLIGKAPKLSEEELEDRLREKATEIAKSSYREGSNAIKNVFSDLISFIVFAITVLSNQRGFTALKAFLDEMVYGLSDSAKAFIIILLTDIFVGFHSPHGWEVLLEGFAKHIGLPPNPAFNSLFIATFPVILDTIFKYWIFRYLNRISPSAVATYKEMNE